MSQGGAEKIGVLKELRAGVGPMVRQQEGGDASSGVTDGTSSKPVDREEINACFER